MHTSTLAGGEWLGCGVSFDGGLGICSWEIVCFFDIFGSALKYLSNDSNIESKSSNNTCNGKDRAGPLARLISAHRLVVDKVLGLWSGILTYLKNNKTTILTRLKTVNLG